MMHTTTDLPRTFSAPVGRVRLAVLLLLTFVPLGLTALLIPLLLPLLRGYVEGAARSFLVYGIANAIGLLIIVSVAGRPALRDLGWRFRWDRQRLLFGIGGFVVGVVIYLVTDAVFRMTGVTGVQGLPGQGGLPEFAALVFGAVILAALYEEVVFRAVWIGGLRPYIGAVAASILSIVAFAAIHYVHFGPGGVIFIACWAIVPTMLFLKFGDLTSPLLMHLLNNAWAYLAVPMLF